MLSTKVILAITSCVMLSNKQHEKLSYSQLFTAVSARMAGTKISLRSRIPTTECNYDVKITSLSYYAAIASRRY